MKIKISFEISEKELAAALIPNGGKITEVKIEETVKRRSATKVVKPPPKPRASRQKKTQT